MESEKEKLMQITYDLYSKDNKISFDDFYNKVIEDEEFNLIFKELWSQAKNVLTINNKNEFNN